MRRDTGPHTPSRRPLSRAIKTRKAVRRIPLKSLEALSRAEVDAGNRLLKLLPVPVPGERLLEEVADEIERLVGTPHDVYFHSARTFPGSEFAVRLEDHFVTTFTLPPDPDVGVMVADMNLVGAWLEELLEDEPPEARRLPPPSARDFGLITFVLMQVVHWLSQRGLPPLAIPTAAPESETTARRLRRQPEVVELVYAVSSTSSAGLVRLFVPGDMVRAMEIFVSKAARAERRRRRLQLGQLGRLTMELPVVAARVPLRRDEVDSLQVGDVLLPCEHGLAVSGLSDEPCGGRLLLNRDADDFLPCRVTLDEASRWQVEFTDMLPREPKDKEREMTTEQEGSAGSGEQATQVLEVAEVDVEVRLGSLPLPVSMLAQIQSGYVLELERSVDDGVDLVVSGKIVGKGELVNVDGRLGVRVLSIET